MFTHTSKIKLYELVQNLNRTRALLPHPAQDMGGTGCRRRSHPSPAGWRQDFIPVLRMVGWPGQVPASVWTANMYLLRSITCLCSVCIAILQLVIPSQALNMGFPIQKPKAVKKVCVFLHFFSSNNLRCTPKVGSDAHPPWMRIWFKFWGTPQIITPSKPQKNAHIKGGPCNSHSCWVINKIYLYFINIFNFF